MPCTCAGVQYLLPATWTSLQPRGASLSRMAELLSWQPAKLAGLSHRKGKIEVGYDADLTVSSAVASDTTSTSSDL